MRSRTSLVVAVALAARIAAAQPAGQAAPASAQVEARLQSDLGRHEEALALLEQVLASSERGSSAWCDALVRKGAEQRALGDLGAAQASFTGVLEACRHDEAARRRVVEAVTGVRQEPELWRGRDEDFAAVRSVAPDGSHRLSISFDSEARPDPFVPRGLESEGFTGEPITITVKDGDFTDILRLFHQVSGLNIVTDSSVRGKVMTLELVDVPWDQALALVLQSQGLGSRVEGNIMWIASLERLAGQPFLGGEAERARQDLTAGIARAVGDCLSRHRASAGRWPESRNVVDVDAIGGPAGECLAALGLQDGWGRSLRYWSDGSTMRLASAGSDGILERSDLAGYLPGIAQRAEDDLVWAGSESGRIDALISPPAPAP